MMDLLGSDASPFVRKVRVLVAEAEITDVIYKPVKASPLGCDETLRSANPLGKIPALVRQNAPTIFDSRVICRFLDHHARAGFYPEQRLWDCLTLEALGDGMMEASVSIVVEKRLRAKELWWDGWFEAQWLKVETALSVIERQWISHLLGPLDMGQVSIACALGYLDLRQPERDWRSTQPELAHWFETFSERVSMQETRPV